MTSEANDLTAKFEKLIIFDAEFQELEKRLFKFCPFDALGAVHVELRHSNFLANILDPLRPHGFGDQVLRSLMLAVTSEAGADVPLTPLEIHLMDLSSAEVRREWRHIDLLIILPDAKIIVCFELKIGSTQHSEQLTRYRNVVQDNWPGWAHVFVFLRPSGEEAEDDAWTSLGYESIARGLEQVADMPGADPMAQGLLEAYINMLRRNFIVDDDLQKLAASLWRKHKEALQFLVENEPDELNDLFKYIHENELEFCKQASIEGLTLVPDHHRGTSGLRFGITEWDTELGPEAMSGSGWTASGRVFLIQLERVKRANGEIVRALLVLGPTESKAREIWFEVIKPSLPNKMKTLSPRWKRIGNKKLFEMTEERKEDFNVEKAFRETAKAVSKFLDTDVRKIDAAIKTVKIDQG